MLAKTRIYFDEDNITFLVFYMYVLQHEETGETEELVEEQPHAQQQGEVRERRPSEKRYSIKQLYDHRSSAVIPQRYGKDYLTKLPDKAIAQVGK